jgi:hypothetical protein
MTGLSDEISDSPSGTRFVEPEALEARLVRCALDACSDRRVDVIELAREGHYNEAIQGGPQALEHCPARERDVSAPRSVSVIRQWLEKSSSAGTTSEP